MPVTEQEAGPRRPIVVKKYANRRLYNTATASFVTLDDLHRMVRQGQDFVVRDDKSGRNITSSILAQIIAEEETKGHGVLPHEYLRQVLKAYGEGVGPQLASYLQQSMDAFANQQRSFTRQMQEMFDGPSAVEQIAEASRRNLEEFQRSFGIFTAARRAPEAAGEEATEALKTRIAGLDERVARLERLVAALASGKPGGQPD